MKVFQTTMEEVAMRRHWQNVMSFGADKSCSQKNNGQQDQKQVIFEVLP